MQALPVCRSAHIHSSLNQPSSLLHHVITSKRIAKFHIRSPKCEEQGKEKQKQHRFGTNGHSLHPIVLLLDLLKIRHICATYWTNDMIVFLTVLCNVSHLLSFDTRSIPDIFVDSKSCVTFHAAAFVSFSCHGGAMMIWSICFYVSEAQPFSFMTICTIRRRNKVGLTKSWQIFGANFRQRVERWPTMAAIPACRRIKERNTYGSSCIFTYSDTMSILVTRKFLYLFGHQNIRKNMLDILH